MGTWAALGCFRGSLFLPWGSSFHVFCHGNFLLGLFEHISLASFKFACREEIEVSCMFVLEEVIDLKLPICFTTFLCFYFFLLFLDKSMAQNKMHVKVKVFE